MGKYKKILKMKKKVDVMKIYGKIKFVTAFPDYKVQVVSAFPDLKVQKVTSFPDKPGKWQIVDSFPNYKIQIVTAFPDFKIKYVDSFPGKPQSCLLYTSDAADDTPCVDLGGRRIIKKKKNKNSTCEHRTEKSKHTRHTQHTKETRH
eukprot:TRINITY_DN14583_c0_g1_i2.p1 TRINITY_DN14583_c0_g1~~TRINITY_DN14583_c0_g1_i2.p1  ORF type:complete len:147 (-),score=21.92 TRINITY_DN14583_c0_g1_i2:26-466(-)